MGDAKRDRFARQMAIVLRVAGGRDIEYDAARFVLRFRLPDGSPMVGNLTNVFVEWGDAPHRELAGRMRQFAAMLVNSTGGLTEWDSVADRLMPVLNPPQLAWNDEAGVLSISRVFQPFVCEMVVVDHPDRMRYVTTRDPKAWGVTEDEVFERARANLTARAMWPGVGDGPDRAILRLAESGDDYRASHLLVEGWLASFSATVGGRPVGFVPDRSLGLTIVADEPEVVGHLLEALEKEYRDGSRIVSPQAYTVDAAGRVVPYSVPAGDPLWNAVHRSEVVLAAREYAAWKEANDPNPQGHVATYEVCTRTRDDTVFSMAVWGEGVTTLLPVCDVVTVVSASHDHVVVPFDAVVREAALEPVPGVYPPRCTTPAWPTPSEIRALRGHVISV